MSSIQSIQSITPCLNEEELLTSEAIKHLTEKEWEPKKVKTLYQLVFHLSPRDFDLLYVRRRTNLLVNSFNIIVPTPVKSKKPIILDLKSNRCLTRPRPGNSIYEKINEIMRKRKRRRI
jgi:hypothetical protein